MPPPIGGIPPTLPPPILGAEPEDAGAALFVLPTVGTDRSFVSVFFNRVPFWICCSKALRSPEAGGGAGAAATAMGGGGGGGPGIECEESVGNQNKKLVWEGKKTTGTNDDFPNLAND